MLDSNESFDLYARPDGRCGIRNHLAVVSTVVCSNVVATRIADELSAEVVAHDAGCLQLGSDRQLTVDMLVGAASNPNVAAALLVGLGCEQQPPDAIVSAVRQSRLDHLTIQGSGGTSAAVRRGVDEGSRLLDGVAEIGRVSKGWRDLTIALRTSDEMPETQDIIIPAFGRLVDDLVAVGATVILPDIWSLMAEPEAVVPHMEDDEGRLRWREFANAKRELLASSGLDLETLLQSGGRHHSTERSLERIGGARISGLLEYGEAPKHPGLWIMDSPNDDLFIGAGLLAAGTHLLVHGSSRPNLYSPPILPVVKLTARASTFAAMADVYDINASAAADADGLSAQIVSTIREVIHGVKSSSERWRGQELAIPRIGATL